MKLTMSVCFVALVVIVALSYATVWLSCRRSDHLSVTHW